MRLASEHDAAAMAECCWDLSLKDFLECFPPPQTGRIVDGYEPNAAAHESFGIPKGVVLNFHRKVNPNVPLSFRDSWGGAQSHNWVKVTLPIDFNGKFRLLSYDPASDDFSVDHIFPTVADLVRAFPVYAQTNASIGNSGDDDADATPTIACGARIKLMRILCKHGDKYLECRPVGQTRLLLLRMNVVGNFTAVHDNSEYLLADLVCMTPRRRRVQFCDEAYQSQRACRIPGVPANFAGDLFVEEPDAFVETSPADDPSVIIGVPHNLDMTVSTVEASFDRGLSLNNFATNNRNIFPVVARVADWDEETAILEHHFVKPGTELVIHGWTRQSKILAQSGDTVYAIPLMYQGKFRIKAQQFNGVYELARAHPGYKITVLHVDPVDTEFPLAVGDIFRVKPGDTLTKKDPKHLKCEKCIMTGTLRSKVVKLPMNSLSKFEEVMEEAKTTEYQIKELVTFVSDQQLDVELISRSPDHKSPESDLPKDKVITLCDFIVEPAVYVSVQVADAPAFHIPLRTLIYMKFVEQLDKSASPLLTRQNPRLSTLDRCVEVLPSEVFNALKTNKPAESVVSAMSTQMPSVPTKASVKATNSNGHVNTRRVEEPTGSQHTSASAMYGYRGTTVDSNGKPIFAASVSSLNPKSQTFGSKLKNKFRRHKSSDNLNGNGRSPGVPAPLLSHHESLGRTTSPPLHKSRFGSRHWASNPVLASVSQPVAHDSVSRRRLSNASMPPPSVQTALHHRYIPHHAARQRIPSSDGLSINGSQASSVSARRSVSAVTPAARPAERQVPRPQGQMNGQLSRSQGHINGHGVRPQGQANGQSTQSQGFGVQHQGLVTVHAAPTQGQVGVQVPPPHGQVGVKVAPPVGQVSVQVVAPQGYLNSQRQPFAPRHQPIIGPVNTMNGPCMNGVVRSNSALSEASRANTMTASQRSVKFVPAGETQNGHPTNPGYMLTPVSEGISVPPGYMLVPVMRSHDVGRDEEDHFDETNSTTTLTRTRSNKIKLMLPPDGNLYHFSVKKMAAFLYETRVDQSVIQLCICDKVDGKKFSHMSEADLHQYGILNAITLYFRSKSYKRRPNFML